MAISTVVGQLYVPVVQDLSINLYLSGGGGSHRLDMHVSQFGGRVEHINASQ